MSCCHRFLDEVEQHLVCLLRGLFFAALQVCLSTSTATYIVSKPTGTYKKVFCHLTEQADLAAEVRMEPPLVTGMLVSTS